MDVVIDSCEIIADLMFKSNNFKTLRDYLTKTGDKLIVPRVVYMEVMNHFKVTLQSELSKLNSAETKIRLLVPSIVVKSTKPDVESEAQTYRKHFLKSLELAEDQLATEEDHWLSQLIERAVEKKRPNTEQKECFRDSIIWLTVLGQGKNDRTKEIAFISRNTNDFGEKGNLFPELRTEAEEHHLTVRYFNKLFDFCSNVADKISFVDSEWIHSKVSIGDVEYNAKHSIGRYEVSQIERAIEVRVHDRMFEDGLDIVNVSAEIDDYYVREQSEGKFQVVVLFSLSVAVEVREYTMDWGGQPDIETHTKEIAGSLECLLTVEGNEVVDEDYGEPMLDYDSVSNWFSDY